MLAIMQLHIVGQKQWQRLCAERRCQLQAHRGMPLHQHANLHYVHLSQGPDLTLSMLSVSTICEVVDSQL